LIRRATFAASGVEVLDRLATTHRVLGLPASRARHTLLRDTFFDTSDGLLRDRRATLRLRLEATGLQSLILTRTSAVSLVGIWEETRITTTVTGSGLYATLAGDSELAREVRELVDPVALRPQAAVDMDREVRDLRSGLLGGTVHQIYLTRMVAHVPGLSRPEQEVTLLELAPAEPSLEVLARRLVETEGLSNDGLDVVERLRQEALGVQEWDAGSRPDSALGLAVLLLRAGRVALTRTGSELVLPATLGSGREDAAAYGARIAPGGLGRDPELVGFAPVRGPGPDLELWLQRCPAEATVQPAALVWIPLEELLERVGSPRLRSPSLVACLALLVRSGMARRLLDEAPGPRVGPVRIPPAGREPDRPPGDDPADWLDRKLSLLDFNRRVLELAEDPAVPLLERFRFLSIVSTNMDEFFVVRVGRIKVRTGQGGDPSSRSARRLDTMAIRVAALHHRSYRCLHDLLLPALAEQGRRLRAWDELDPAQREILAARVRAEVIPLLTPRSLTPSPGQPFPRLHNLELSLAVVLKDPARDRTALGHVPVPDPLPRFLEIPGTRDLVLMEEVLGANASELFPTFEVVASHAFRIFRYQGVDIDEARSTSLLRAVADEVHARPFKPVVRIEVAREMPEDVRAFLLRELRSERGTGQTALNRNDVQEVDGPLDLGDLRQLVELGSLGGGDLYPPFEPVRPVGNDDSIFDRLDRGDLLVHHPYDDFGDTVGRLLREAATDPGVVAIKLTLYRTGRDSPVMEALLEALARGKEVAVFVELKARFDEESNIAWTRRLAEAGAHVVYGLVGYKTHAKTALVVRRGNDGRVTRYVHVGTGNYNATTARIYTDLGLLSADPELGSDLHDFFNELTGSAGPPVKDYRRLWVAPHSLARELLGRIETETRNAKAGRPARIQAKMNGLSDRKVAKALYRASRAGVRVELVVRAMCTLRPGVEGLSENISVRSVLGRFLEHARLFYFENGGEPLWYLGSADWRKRNLRRRVEVVVSVTDPAARARLRTILDTELAGGGAWILRSDGAYERSLTTGPGVQERLLAAAAHPPRVEHGAAGDALERRR
jgi:polyphosphate kinase